ncbi:MAG: hypothetical protein GF384_08250 [Elusimicrobia bacterium]|nr:hypothetical protein [Elusimicrobiota bacterium]MBD3412618.1 hypothetical protein [Elusimicrobiota bacterium]
MRGTKKIAISGYYGTHNAGDELICASLTMMIRHYIPDASITVFSADPRRTSSMYNVASVQRKNPFAILGALRTTDMLVTGGGGIFQDVTSSLSLYYYLLVICCARLLGKITVIYAVDVSPELKSLNRRLVVWICSRTHMVSVRTEQSRALLAESGMPKERLHRVCDPVFLCNEFPAIHSEQTASSRKKIIWVIREYPRRFADTRSTLMDALSNTCRLWAQKPVDQILIPFHAVEDGRLAEDLEKQSNGCLSLCTWESIHSVVAEVVSAHVVISSRLHGLILACALGKPCVGIIPDARVDGGKMKQISRENTAGIFIEDRDIEPQKLYEVIDTLLNEDQSRYRQSRDQYIRSAKTGCEQFWNATAQLLNR